MSVKLFVIWNSVFASRNMQYFLPYYWLSPGLSIIYFCKTRQKSIHNLALFILVPVASYWDAVLCNSCCDSVGYLSFTMTYSHSPLSNNMFKSMYVSYLSKVKEIQFYICCGSGKLDLIFVSALCLKKSISFIIKWLPLLPTHPSNSSTEGTKLDKNRLKHK